MSNIGIGIDLGTTYSCVAVWKNGKIEVIPNDGERTTPSVVSFSDTERLIGQAAKNNITKNYENTIYDTKRLIGRKFNEKVVQEDMKHWPFKVKKDTKSERPVIEVTYKKEKKTFYPEEISSMILKTLQKAAQTYMGKEIVNAVITVPAHFNNSQRQSTKDAGRIAGLNVLRIISEPTAAAIAYGLENKTDEDKKVLVFDLGGGTFDVTVLILGKNNLLDDDEDQEKFIEVKSTTGHPHLGGEDFDNRLLKYCIETFKDKKKIDISYNQKAIRRLKINCERAKRDLSSAISTNIEIDNLADGEDFSLNIMRAKFEELCKDLFDSCLPYIDQALKEVNYTKKDIDEVVLVGGSSRIPYIQEMIENYFPGKTIKKDINADEAVAIGAAYQAKNILNHEDDGLEKLECEEDKIEKLIVVDVSPLSLGIRVKGDITNIIIPKNSILPVHKTKQYFTAHDNQKFADIRVYQGENKDCKLNFELGNFQVEIKQNNKPAGKVKFDVTFSLDVNCILNVSAVEYVEGSKEFKKNNINAKTDGFTEEEIEELINNAKDLENADLEKEKKIKARNYLQKICFEKRQKNEYTIKANEILQWIKQNKNASEKDYLEKLKEIE